MSVGSGDLGLDVRSSHVRPTRTVHTDNQLALDTPRYGAQGRPMVVAAVPDKLDSLLRGRRRGTTGVPLSTWSTAEATPRAGYRGPTPSPLVDLHPMAGFGAVTVTGIGESPRWSRHHRDEPRPRTPIGQHRRGPRCGVVEPCAIRTPNQRGYGGAGRQRHPHFALGCRCRRTGGVGVNPERAARQLARLGSPNHPVPLLKSVSRRGAP